MMGFERDEEYYDIKLPSKKVPDSWIKMYWIVFGLLFPYANYRIAELGCGPGFFSKLLFGQGVMNYLGIDFSQRCLDIARKGMYGSHLNQHFEFEKHNLVKDDETLKPMLKNCGVFVLIEVLEHITEDFKVLDLVPAGKVVILTGPNTYDEAHVRCYSSLNDFLIRYERLIDFDFGGQLEAGRGKQFYIVRGIKK